MLHSGAAQRKRGRIAPAALGLIEGEFCTVNAFRAPEKTENPARNGA